MGCLLTIAPKLSNPPNIQFVVLFRFPESGAFMSKGEESDPSEISKNAIFAGLDGSMTTFVTVTACWGADFSGAAVVVLGLAHLLGGGLLLGMGDLLLSQAEQSRCNMERQQVQNELISDMGGKIREIIDLYVDKGMVREDARTIVQTLAKYDHIFLDQIMIEQHSLLPHEEEIRLASSAVTMLAFAFSGLVPLAPYLLSYFLPISSSFLPWASLSLSVFFFFTLGALKQKLVELEGSWLHSAIVMTANGGFAASIGFIVGLALKDVARAWIDQ